jgi:peptide/nickel transport system permease protein
LFTALLVGSVLVEATFTLPGMGSLLISAVSNKDLPVLEGIVMLTAVLVVSVNLVVDVLYAFIDPRMSIRGERS